MQHRVIKQSAFRPPERRYSGQMTSTQSGNGYWVTQIAVCGFAALAAPVLGIVLFILEPDEPGMGVMLILTGMLFLGCLIWLVRSYRRMSTVQRAIYAWAITQQHGSSPRRGLTSDAAVMASAAKAKNGELTRDELLALAALRPENPYPGTMPPAPGV
jgi:membrane-bound ClpP family serine protease